MSNRGCIVTNPQSRPKLIAETASYIPLFWPSLLSSDDLSSAESIGEFELDRVESINRCAERVPLYVKAFEDVPDVSQFAETFIAKVRSKKCKTIGLDIFDLVTHEDGLMPPLDVAVKAIESGDPDYAVTIPARTVNNPYTGRTTDIPEQNYTSLRDVLNRICEVGDHTLRSSSKEDLQEWFTGHIWE